MTLISLREQILKSKNYDATLHNNHVEAMAAGKNFADLQMQIFDQMMINDPEIANDPDRRYQAIKEASRIAAKQHADIFKTYCNCPKDQAESLGRAYSNG